MPEHAFTVGICATDDSTSITRLLERVTTEELPPQCRISDVVVVVSGSTDGTDTAASSFSYGLPHSVIVEKERSGKAAAVNRIMQTMKGRHLIMINGDALPLPGALSAMMGRLTDEEISVVCALPVPAPSNGGSMSRHSASFLWELHNSTMEMMKSEGECIHLTDEMIGLNPPAMTQLPEGTVNDGAYIATRAQYYSQKVDFCGNAVVEVSVPSSMAGLMRQRRRILFGHMMVREMTGALPGTLEFRFKQKPLLCLKILVHSVTHNPEGFLLLPFILAMEIFSYIGALRDRKSRAGKHTVWTRIENASWR